MIKRPRHLLRYRGRLQSRPLDRRNVLGTILSVFNRNGEAIDRQVIELMLAASLEREVDGHDVWIDDHVALGHQHFWITPQEWGERQPLHDVSGRWTITADARLDNRGELFRKLDLDDTGGNGISDAALILLAYRRWGTACVEQFLGDFAFAIWDGNEGHLFIARDALGVRGLCFSIDRDRCLVGSDVRQLLAHPAVRPKINEGKVVDYLEGLYRDQEETYYENIHYCPPAHCLVITVESIRKWRYWDIDPQIQIRYKDDHEYAAHFLELLTEAVRCRLRTVGPVGISLSGGLDSTSLAAVASTLLPRTGLPQKRLKSFSYVFDELAICDERRYIRPVVDRYQLDATFILGDDKWTLQDSRNWPVDLGFVTSEPYSRLLQSVMEAAKQEGCRLLLAGYFGDVLTVGGSYWAAGMMADFRLGELAKTVKQHSFAVNLHRDLVINGLRHMIPHTIRSSYGHYRSRRNSSCHPGIHPDLADRTQLQARREREFDRDRRLSFGPDQWHRYLSLTHNIFAQGASVEQTRYSKNGLELSRPYWDRRLIEFVMAVPADQLGRPHRDRWLHRNAVSGLLPASVHERRGRTTFGPLMEKGLRIKEQSTVERLIYKPLIVEKKYVRANWIQGEWNSSKFWSSSSSRHFFWKCLCLEMWLKRVLSPMSSSQVPGDSYE